jgi:hypothetical protein
MTEQLRLELELEARVAGEHVQRDRYQDELQAFAERYQEGYRRRHGYGSPYRRVDADDPPLR